MKIAAFDVASNTGVAVGVPGSAPIYWSKHLGKPPDERRLAQILRLTDNVIVKHKPDLIYVEAPAAGDFKNTLLTQLVGCVKGCAAARCVDVKEVYPNTVRKHFLGKSLTSRNFPDLSRPKAKLEIKRIVMRRCQALGWNPEDDDQADALAMLDYAFATEVRGYQSKPVGGLF